MRKLLPLVLLVCVVVLAAVPAAAGDQSDQQIADAAVPDLSDLPDGWDSEPGEDLGNETGIDECRRLDRLNQAALEQAHTETPVFLDPGDPEGRTTIEGAVFVFRKVKGAERYFAGYEADSARDCFQAIGDQQVEDYPSNEVGTSDLDVEGGDDAVGYRLDIEGTDDTGATDAVVLDFVVVRIGRAVVNLGAQGGEEPPPLDDVIDSMLERLEQAL